MPQQLARASAPASVPGLQRLKSPFTGTQGVRFGCASNVAQYVAGASFGEHFS